MSEGKKLPQYLAAICVCIGAMGTGTVIGWTSNITDKLKDGDLGKLKITDTAMVGSMMTLGAFFACLPVGWIADVIGRKPTVLLSSIPFAIGWALITFPFHVAMVYAGRFLTGVAGGTFCITAPLYTSEIAQSEIRGTLGTFFQLFITIGIMFAGIFGHFLPMLYYNLFCLAVPIVFAIVFIFQSETPVYSLRKGKTEDADKAYKRLRGPDYNPADEIKAIQEQIAKDLAKKNFWEAMKSKAAKKATLICFMLMFYQQLSGINAVMFYSKDIFISAGSTIAPHLCTITIGVVQVVATVISSWLVEKVGRKILMMGSTLFMGISTFLLGIFYSINNYELMSKDGIKTIGFIPVLSLVIYIIAFSMGAGPIPWLASSEIFPPDIKAKCSSAAGAFNWLLAYIVTLCYHPIAKAIGNDITFYIFGGISITGFFFVWFIMPETRGKSFAEIEAELEA